MSSTEHPLVVVREKGLYCPRGDFFIDPWGGVEHAVITHAHSDHARWGSRQYYAVQESRGLLGRRLGASAVIDYHAYGESFRLGEVLVSFHPAGHILGSAQIRLECEGRIWVISGDYKRQADPTCRPFEPVPCDVFISEATFGLPIYNWQATEQVAEEIFEWWRENQRVGRNSLLACYSLGKAQRVLHALAAFTDQPVLTHGATEQLNEAYREEGVSLIETIKVNESHKNCRGELILAPPSAIDSSWAKRFGDAERGFASGWMQIRGQRRRRGYERGFVLSDHADWSGLLQSIRESEAQKIYVTHGYASELSRYLRDQGYDAEPLQTLFVGEGDS
jgi:putative mRNA 3-end processing factor